MPSKNSSAQRLIFHRDGIEYILRCIALHDAPGTPNGNGYVYRNREDNGESAKRDLRKGAVEGAQRYAINDMAAKASKSQIPAFQGVAEANSRKQTNLVLRKKDIAGLHLSFCGEAALGGDFPGAFLLVPEGEGPHPVIILLGGSEGDDQSARAKAPYFYAHGFAVLGLPYYSPPMEHRVKEKIYMCPILRNIDTGGNADSDRFGNMAAEDDAQKDTKCAIQNGVKHNIANAGGGDGLDPFAAGTVDMPMDQAKHYKYIYKSIYKRKFPQLPEAFNHISVDYLFNAVSAVRNIERIDSSRIGVYGVSKGAEYALLAGSLGLEVAAIAAIVPSDIIWEGFRTRSGGTGASGFSFRGEMLDFVPYADRARAFLSTPGSGPFRIDPAVPVSSPSKPAASKASAAQLPASQSFLLEPLTSQAFPIQDSGAKMDIIHNDDDGDNNISNDIVNDDMNDDSAVSVYSLKDAHERGRAQHAGRVEGARIKAENIFVPLMLVGGDLDHIWPSGQMARNIARRRKARGLPTHLLTFARGGHYISGPARKDILRRPICISKTLRPPHALSPSSKGPVTRPCIEENIHIKHQIRDNAWTATIDFFIKNLKMIPDKMVKPVMAKDEHIPLPSLPAKPLPGGMKADTAMKGP